MLKLKASVLEELAGGSLVMVQYVVVSELLSGSCCCGLLGWRVDWAEVDVGGCIGVRILVEVETVAGRRKRDCSFDAVGRCMKYCEVGSVLKGVPSRSCRVDVDEPSSKSCQRWGGNCGNLGR